MRSDFTGSWGKVVSYKPPEHKRRKIRHQRTFLPGPPQRIANTEAATINENSTNERVIVISWEQSTCFQLVVVVEAVVLW